MDGVLSRLTVLEALVSRLLSGEDKGAGTVSGSDGEEVLQEAFAQVTEERNQLQEDKERLNMQIQELQRRVGELSQEAETLRQKPCRQAHISTGTRDSKPASGMCIFSHPFFCSVLVVFSCLFDYSQNIFVADSECEKSTGQVAVNHPSLSKGIGIYNTLLFYGFVTHACLCMCVTIYRRSIAGFRGDLLCSEANMIHLHFDIVRVLGVTLVYL